MTIGPAKTIPAQRLFPLEKREQDGLRWTALWFRQTQSPRPIETVANGP